MGCPEMPARYYHFSLSNNAEDGNSSLQIHLLQSHTIIVQLLGGRSFKTRIVRLCAGVEATLRHVQRSLRFFFLLRFGLLLLEDGLDRLSRNVDKELPLLKE